MYLTISIAILLLSAFKFTAANNTNDTQCYQVTPGKGPIIPVGKTVRFMQYNVEWLFLRTYNGCPGSSCSWPTLQAAETHMSAVASIVNEYKPDIMNLCEVEGCYELTALINETVTATSTYQPYLLFGTDTSTGQNVGLITKYNPDVSLQRTSASKTYPIPGSKCNYTGTGSTGVSKHYYTAFVAGNLYVHVVGAHLLAIPTEPSRCAAREAQASILQDLVVNLLASSPPSAGMQNALILMGDMNDYDGVILDSNSDKPTSHVLDILKGTMGAYAGAYELVSVAGQVAQTERYTDWWDPNGDCKATQNEMSMIDHVLITPNLVEKIQQVLYPHPYVESCSTYNSDHYPIIVDFIF